MVISPYPIPFGNSYPDRSAGNTDSRANDAAASSVSPYARGKRTPEERIIQGEVLERRSRPEQVRNVDPTFRILDVEIPLQYRASEARPQVNQLRDGVELYRTIQDSVEDEDTETSTSLDVFA